MAHTDLNADQIIETLKFINFVPFSDFKEFRERMPDFLKKKYKIDEIDENNITGDEKLEKIGEKICYRILNFLYSGVWDLEVGDYEDILIPQALKAFGIADLKEETENKIKNIENIEDGSEINETIETKINNEILKQKVKELIIKLKGDWQVVFEAHKGYITLLKDKEVSKIIVYEAPRYPKGKKVNYLLLNDAEGPYVDAIKNFFDKNKTAEEILVEKAILFFDLLMLPIAIDSDLRRKWSTCDSFKIKNKQLPVVLLELNLKHFNEKLKNKLSLTPTFALGMPHLTALSIYNYISTDKNKKLSEIGIESLTKLNTAKVKKLIPNKVVPLFKSCFVNISNNPDADLLKNAFAPISCNFFRKLFKKKLF
jgi:hypothetical protein